MKQILKNNAIYLVALIVLIIIGLYLRYQEKDAPITENAVQNETTTGGSLSISSKDIKEENFSGKVSVIKGSSELAIKSQSYINEAVAEFKKQADTDVPAMRKEFGEDSSAGQYELIIEAKHAKSEKAESVIMLYYGYTGGAHGNSLYKVITASPKDGKILSLSDVIKKDKQDAFTALIKRELLAWRPDETMDSSPVFVEDVETLKFDSFANWSLDEKNLTLYFSQYEIGPGVLGPVTFPVPIEKVKDFLQ